ncbi:MAG: hypothetical protein M0030_30465 [Actinomycetota bacterium]|jgi:hypothetical protein|nr:hypothetical protein [Actinomycetota bacterium]
MNAATPQDEAVAALRAELADVDREIARLRRSAEQIRSGIGEAEDPADRGALIQAADEQDNLGDELVVRREGLRRRIAEAERQA